MNKCRSRGGSDRRLSVHLLQYRVTWPDETRAKRRGFGRMKEGKKVDLLPNLQDFVLKSRTRRLFRRERDPSKSGKAENPEIAIRWSTSTMAC